MTWFASFVSAGGSAEKHIKLKTQTKNRVFTGRIWGALEMKVWKSAKLRKRKRRDHFGGSGSILSRMRIDSRITLPTIPRLVGLSLSTVPYGMCHKALL